MIRERLRRWGDAKPATVPALWMDDAEWDFARLAPEAVPFDARAADFKWTYVLQRTYKTEEVNGGQEKVLTYEPYNIKLPTRADDVTPNALNDATSWLDYTDFLRADPPEMERVAKAIIIAFIVSAFLFGLVLILVLMGD